MIALIAAVAKNGVIGNSGKIPWHLPADFLYFKESTMGHPVIMGKVTYLSIGKPLPGRTNIVLTRDIEEFQGARTASSISEALDIAQKEDDTVFFIGGAAIYAQSIDLADRLYITEVECEPEGDTFFPEIDESVWREVSRTHREADDKNSHNMDFVLYARRR
jgi:dihydrofolate reductase